MRIYQEITDETRENIVLTLGCALANGHQCQITRSSRLVMDSGEAKDPKKLFDRLMDTFVKQEFKYLSFTPNPSAYRNEKFTLRKKKTKAHHQKEITPDFLMSTELLSMAMFMLVFKNSCVMKAVPEMGKANEFVELLELLGSSNYETKKDILCTLIKEVTATVKWMPSAHNRPLTGFYTKKEPDFEIKDGCLRDDVSRIDGQLPWNSLLLELNDQPVIAMSPVGRTTYNHGILINSKSKFSITAIGQGVIFSPTSHDMHSEVIIAESRRRQVLSSFNESLELRKKVNNELAAFLLKHPEANIKAHGENYIDIEGMVKVSDSVRKAYKEIFDKTDVVISIKLSPERTDTIYRERIDITIFLGVASGTDKEVYLIRRLRAAAMFGSNTVKLYSALKIADVLEITISKLEEYKIEETS